MRTRAEQFIRIRIFHAAVWVLIVFYPFVDIVCRLAGYDPTQIGQHTERLPVVLAMFHTCFNVVEARFGK